MTTISLLYLRKLSRIKRPSNAPSCGRAVAASMMRLVGITGVASACLVVAVAAVLLSGCSFDGAFPAVHDMPAARTETLLTADEVKRSTDNLISDRDRLAAMAK